MAYDYSLKANDQAICSYIFNFRIAFDFSMPLAFLNDEDEPDNNLSPSYRKIHKHGEYKTRLLILVASIHIPSLKMR
jgi:hypothetical protein